MILTPAACGDTAAQRVRSLGWDNLERPFAELSSAIIATLNTLAVPFSTVESGCYVAQPPQPDGEQMPAWDRDLRVTIHIAPITIAANSESRLSGTRNGFFDRLIQSIWTGRVSFASPTAGLLPGPRVLVKPPAALRSG